MTSHESHSGSAHRAALITLAITCLAPACADPAGSALVESEVTLDVPEDCVADGHFLATSTSATAMGTVETATWRTRSPGVDHVVFAFEDGPSRVTPPQTTGTEHQAHLVGVPAHTEVFWQAVSEVDGTRYCSDVKSYETGALPTAMPEVSITAIDESQAGDGFLIIPIITDTSTFVTMFDLEGRAVWALEVPQLVYRAALSLDGMAVLYNVSAEDAGRDGRIHRVWLDGEAGPTTSILGSHGDFVELPDGEFASLQWNIEDFGDRRVLGDALVHADSAGTVLDRWGSLDHYRPDLDKTYPHTYLADDGVEDWTHFNGVSYDTARDAVMVSIAGWQAIARFENWDLAWLLSASWESDFSTTDSGLVESPHSVQMLSDDSLLVFDRNDGASTCSNASEIRVDHDELEATEVWSYESDDCLHVKFLGEARDLGNGQRLVIFSDAGQADLVTLDGDVVWRMNTDLGAAMGFGDLAPSL